MENNLDELRDNIRIQLDMCGGNGKNTPYICSNIQDPEAKSKMIELVLSYVLEKKIGISEALSEIERDFNPNIADNPY